MQDVDIKTDPQTGESRGFGFLLYKDEASIEEVVNNGPHNLGMHFKDFRPYFRKFKGSCGY